MAARQSFAFVAFPARDPVSLPHDLDVSVGADTAAVPNNEPAGYSTQPSQKQRFALYTPFPDMSDNLLPYI